MWRMRTIGHTVALAMALKYREQGRRIAALRERKGLSQEDAARLCEVSNSGYQKWELGGGIRGANLRRLAEVLETTPEEIRGDAEMPDPFSLARVLDENTQIFAKWCLEMTDTLKRVEASVDRLTITLMDGDASSPALQGFREALERQAAAHGGDAPPEKRRGTGGQR